MSKKQKIVFIDPSEMQCVAPRVEAAVAGLTKYYGEVAARGDISFGVVKAKGGDALAIIATPDAVLDPRGEAQTCRNILRGHGFHF